MGEIEKQNKKTIMIVLIYAFIFLGIEVGYIIYYVILYSSENIKTQMKIINHYYYNINYYYFYNLRIILLSIILKLKFLFLIRYQNKVDYVIDKILRNISSVQKKSIINE
jgi:hypothetical protein